MSVAPSSSPPVFIYALTDEHGQICYIGQSENPTRRQKAHYYVGRSRAAQTDGTAYQAWIRDIVGRGITPGLVILEETDYEGADEAEDRHIDAHWAQGSPLVNSPLSPPYGRRSRKGGDLMAVPCREPLAPMTQAALHLGISVSMMRKWLERGICPGVKDDRGWMVPLAAIVDYLEREFARREAKP